MAYDWLTINPTSGSGTGVITTTIASHSGYATRSKGVVVTVTNGSDQAITETVTFRQTGTGVAGAGQIKMGSTSVSGEVQASSLAQGTNMTFTLSNTNAKNIQYYVEYPTPAVSAAGVSSILGPPRVNATITSVTDGTSKVSFTTFASTSTTKDGKVRVTYTLDGKGLGGHQKYTLAINSTIFGTFRNRISKSVAVTYGLNAIIGTGVNCTGTTSVPLTSISIKYPASSITMDVTATGTAVGSGGGKGSITISGPSDITWTAFISGGAIS